MSCKQILSILLISVIFVSCSSVIDDKELGFVKDKNRQVCLISYKNNIIVHYDFNLQPHVTTTYYLKDDYIILSTENFYLKTKVLQNHLYTISKDGLKTSVQLNDNYINDCINSDLFQKNHIVENITITQSIKKLKMKTNN